LPIEPSQNYPRPKFFPHCILSKDPALREVLPAPYECLTLSFRAASSGIKEKEYMIIFDRLIFLIFSSIIM